MTRRLWATNGQQSASAALRCSLSFSVAVYLRLFCLLIQNGSSSESASLLDCGPGALTRAAGLLLGLREAYENLRDRPNHQRPYRELCSALPTASYGHRAPDCSERSAKLLSAVIVPMFGRRSSAFSLISPINIAPLCTKKPSRSGGHVHWDIFLALSVPEPLSECTGPDSSRCVCQKFCKHILSGSEFRILAHSTDSEPN